MPLSLWERLVGFFTRLRTRERPRDHEEAEARIQGRDAELREAVAGRLQAQSEKVPSRDERRALLQARRKVLDGGEAALLLAMGVMRDVEDKDVSDVQTGEEGN